METYTIGTPNLASCDILEAWIAENIKDRAHTISIKWWNPNSLPHESTINRPDDYEIIRGGDRLYMGRKTKEWKDRLVLDLTDMVFELPLDQIKELKFTIL